MTAPVTTEALVEALAARIGTRQPISQGQADAQAKALVAGPLAPLLAAHQQVTAERDEARSHFGNFTPTVERIALLMGQVWLEAKGAAGDTVADFEEFAMLAPEDCADVLHGRDDTGVCFRQATSGTTYLEPLTIGDFRAARAATAREKQE